MAELAVGAAIGLVATLIGTVVSYQLQERAQERRRIDDAIHQAMVHSRHLLQDTLDYGMAFVSIGDLPEPAEEDDPEAARAFGLKYQMERLAEADLQLRTTERELQRVGVDLAIYTTLHRRPGETVTGFDVIADELCGRGADTIRGTIAVAEGPDDVYDLVFRCGVLVKMFEDEAIEFRRKRLGRRLLTPEFVTSGAPREAVAPGAASEKRPE